MGTIDFGTTFNRAFDLYKVSLKVLVPIAIIFNVGIGVVAAVLVLVGLGGGGAAGFVGGGGIGAGIGALVGMIVAGVILVAVAIPVSMIEYGMLVRGAGEYDDGQEPTIGSLVESSKPWGDLISTSFLLAGIGIGLFILFIIPVIGWFGVPILAVYLFTRWAFVVPVIVYEGRAGKDALDRSAELVGGNFWTVLGISVAGGILVGIVTNILSAIVGAVIPDALSFIETVLDMGINGLGMPFMALLLLLMYRQSIGVDSGSGTTQAAPDAYAGAYSGEPAAPIAPAEPTPPASPNPPADPSIG